MYALSASSWPGTLDDRTEARDRRHQVAIYDARIADGRSSVTRGATASSLLDRVRQVIGLAPATTDCVACAA